MQGGSKRCKGFSLACPSPYLQLLELEKYLFCASVISFFEWLFKNQELTGLDQLEGGERGKIEERKRKKKTTIYLHQIDRPYA